MRAVAFVVGLLLYPALAGAADKLNIKTGLWEIAATTDFSGMPPLPKEMLDKLTPEQRAEMEAAIKKGSGERESEVSRECISERDLERPFESANPDECKQEIVRSTRTTQEVQLTCTGEYKGSGTFLITTPTAETMTGVLDLSVGEGPNAMKVKANMKGRWLGPDCGEEADEDDEADAAEEAMDEMEEDEDF
jgi:hypothetical protein